MRPASPVDADDIPAELAHSILPTRPRLPLPPRAGHAARLEAQVLAQLSPNPVEEDTLIRDLGVPASILAPLLVQLELAGKLTRVSGGRISLH